ncbi:MAG TPA: tyrosine-type recombinase/integrase, partial [Abditibacteriaceae bacterium]
MPHKPSAEAGAVDALLNADVGDDLFYGDLSGEDDSLDQGDALAEDEASDNEEEDASSEAGAPLFGALDHFASHLQDARNASPHTVRSYLSDLQQFIEWLCAEKLLRASWGWDKVSYLMVRRYLGHLTQKGYERRSVVRKLSSLKAFFKWMEREGAVTKNPAAAVLSPKTSRPLPDVLEFPEIERMLGLPDGEKSLGMRDRALLETMYATGMRVAEVAALSMGDIDWRNGEIRVALGKGSKERVVLLGRFALVALRQYVEKARPPLMARRKNALAA